jgi:sugar transferase (PEP-CTERM/EpsH1 system associated)
MPTDRKMKICHITTRFDIGGMENGLVNICNGLDRSRFMSAICCLNGAGEMVQRLKPDVSFYNMNFKEGKSLSAIFNLALFFRKIKPDVVHTHAWGGGSFYGIVSAIIGRVPIIINGEHGIFFTKPRQILLQRLLFWLCDANLTVSNSLMIKTQKIIGVSKNKITVIKNGVDIYKYSGEYPKEAIFIRLKNEGFNFNPQSFIIFSIGSLKSDKMQIRLLKALRYIKIMEKSFIINLFIIGNGPDRKMLEDFTKEAQLSDIVFFLGTRDDIHELLSISDLLVSVSIEEGLSNVMLEAMSSGVPVVSTESLGAAELITNGINGFLVEQENADQLAEKIIQLYEDRSLLKNLGRNAKQIIHENYSITKMVQEYEKLYSFLAKKKGFSISKCI